MSTTRNKVNQRHRWVLMSFIIIANAESFSPSLRSQQQPLQLLLSRDYNKYPRPQPGLRAARRSLLQKHKTKRHGFERIVEVRGGANPDAQSGRPLPSLAQRCRQFSSRNFFLLGMIVAVCFARAAPSLGKSGGILRSELFIGKFGVACIFLLSGLSLELSELKQAASNYKLNISVLISTFVLWPLLVGLPLTHVLSTYSSNLLSPPLRDGLLILTCLPTTINMCVILTTAAGGSVATALFGAVVSNLAGIFITPLLLLQLFGKYIQLPFIEMLTKLCSQVLLPVAVGQVLRQCGGKPIYSKNAKFFKRLQEVILLGIVWTAFCNTFCVGLGLELRHALTLLTVIPVMHLLSLGILFKAFSLPFFNFSRKEVVAAMFTASHKTLAFGLPLINTIFEGSPNVAAYCTPLMFIHPLQLILGSLCVPSLSTYVEGEDQETSAVST